MDYQCDETKPRCLGCQRNGLVCSLAFLVPISTLLGRHKNHALKPHEVSSSIQKAIPQASQAWLMLPNTSLSSALEPYAINRQSRELLYHYEATVHLTIDQSSSLDVWKTQLPQLAMSHPFLMHGVLALSALHLSHVTPSLSSRLSATATFHEQLALPIFRKSIAKSDLAPIHAVFGFSTIVVLYILGSCNVRDKSRLPSKDDQVPHWLFALRGVMTLLSNNFPVLASGPFGPLLNRHRDPRQHSDNPDDLHLARLNILLSPERGTSLPLSSASLSELRICEKALDQLREAYALPYSQFNTWWNVKSAVYSWAGLVSHEFVDLVILRRPEALVILAYYCALVKRLDSCWYFAGVGQAMLGSIEEALTLEWQPWIRWAIEQPVS